MFDFMGEFQNGQPTEGRAMECSERPEKENKENEIAHDCLQVSIRSNCSYDSNLEVRPASPKICR